MPRTAEPSPQLLELIRRQDGVVHLDQLDRSLTETAVHKRVVRRRWQRLLPRVVVTTTAPATRRQLLVAAWLWAGQESAVDGPDACRWHCADVLTTAPERVHVVVPSTSPARTRDFVVVRRAIAEIEVHSRGLVPYVDAATALIVAARGAKHERAAIALLARGLQLGVATVRDLRVARERIGDKWCRPLDRALSAVGVGLRSPAENDYRALILTSRVLPEPAWNQWVDLGDGGTPVCLDALWDKAALADEVLGKRYHAWGEQFESTEARRARLVAAGLTVLGCTPLQIRQHGAQVLGRLEQTYTRLPELGLPPGIRLLNDAIAA